MGKETKMVKGHLLNCSKMFDQLLVIVKIDRKQHHMLMDTKLSYKAPANPYRRR
jgi:hypothetical protein